MITQEEYDVYMKKPLSVEEKQILIDHGWEFANENYIFIPDDYDGCMASGLNGIRKVLMGYTHHDLYIKHQANMAKIIEELNELVNRK